MAQGQLDINPKLKILKKDINYEYLISHLPKDKLVIVNWDSCLSKLTDTTGNEWIEVNRFPGMDVYEGRVEVILSSGKESIGVKVHSFSQGIKSAIDSALWEATFTSAPFVSYKLEAECFSDFCLIPAKKPNIHFMKFVYGNILVELRHSNDNENILPVAHYLQSVMEKAVAANPEQKLPARPKFSYSVQPNQLRADETFTVTVTPGYQKESWKFDVAEDLLSDNVEYEEDLGDNVYKFTAKAAGKGEAVFSLMDKNTLWVFTDTVTVNIDPNNN